MAVSQECTRTNFGEKLFIDMKTGTCCRSDIRQIKINLSADVLNLFSLKHISAQENYSSVAPYKRYEYLNETRNLIRLNLTLNLSYGKNHKEFSKRINDNTNSESSIIKGEK